MTAFTVRDAMTGSIFGIYEGPAVADALDAMAREAGYDNLVQAREERPLRWSEGDFIVEIAPEPGYVVAGEFVEGCGQSPAEAWNDAVRRLTGRGVVVLAPGERIPESAQKVAFKNGLRTLRASALFIAAHKAGNLGGSDGWTVSGDTVTLPGEA